MMQQCTTALEMKKWVKDQKKQGNKIGLVPTMGYLHEGHLSLMRKAKEENDVVVVSIFVNPLQFGEGEDYERYPKDQERDLQLAKEVGVDVVFTPSVKEMYPNPMSATLTVHEGVNVLCGANRPGHFDGVATVVMKLFGIMNPDRAYFGLKDAQQVAVIENLVRDYHLDVDIVRGPIIREEDGLAISSRNVNLTKEERVEAKNIYKSLKEVQSFLINKEEFTVQVLEKYLQEKLQERISGTIDYTEIRAFPSLKKLDSLSSYKGDIIIAIAIRYSKVRLIDNIMLRLSNEPISSF